MALSDILSVSVVLRSLFLGYGGALCQRQNGTLYLAQCIFTRNAATYGGGALYASGLISGQTEGSTFLHNMAKGGGAICSEAGYLVQFRVYNCTFVKNIAPQMAGALLFNTTSALVSYSNLTENTSPIAGTIAFWGHSSILHMSHCNIWKSNYIGGQNLSSFGEAVWSLLAKQLVFDCVHFDDNPMGGLMLGETRAEIQNCSFSRNTGVGGAIRATSSKLLTIRNTVFNNNGGVSVPALSLGRNTLVQNCTFEIPRLSRHPFAIQVDSTNNATLRLCRNFFHVIHAKAPVQLDKMISLFSTSPSVSTSNLYFWDTWYQVNNSKAHLVDRDFMHNIETNGITTDNPVNVSGVFGQFASRKFLLKTYKQIFYNSREFVDVELFLNEAASVHL